MGLVEGQRGFGSIVKLDDPVTTLPARKRNDKLKDLNNLTILLEPGTWQFNDSSNRPGGEDDYPANKLLRSVKL